MKIIYSVKFSHHAAGWRGTPVEAESWLNSHIAAANKLAYDAFLVSYPQPDDQWFGERDSNRHGSVPLDQWSRLKPYQQRLLSELPRIAGMPVHVEYGYARYTNLLPSFFPAWLRDRFWREQAGAWQDREYVAECGGMFRHWLGLGYKRVWMEGIGGPRWAGRNWARERGHSIAATIWPLQPDSTPDTKDDAPAYADLRQAYKHAEEWLAAKTPPDRWLAIHGQTTHLHETEFFRQMLGRVEGLIVQNSGTRDDNLYEWAARLKREMMYT